MNRIFKVIKSKRTGSDIAVSELTSSKSGARRLSASLILASGLCAGGVLAEEAENNGIKDDTVTINGNYTNNGVITKQTGDGNAVIFENGLLTNNGVISGNIKIDKSGNSVAGDNSIRTKNSANGIYSTNDVIVKENSGTINGNAILTGGTAKAISRSTVTGSTARGDVFVEAATNGIYGTNNVEVKNNSGIISGNAVLKGGTAIGGVGIYTDDSVSESMVGVVANDAGASISSSANGMYNKGSANVTSNSGIISGNAVLTGGDSEGENLTETYNIEHLRTSVSADSSSGVHANNSANGVYGTNNVKVHNSGIISGNAVLTAGTAKEGMSKLSIKGISGSNNEVVMINTNASGYAGAEASANGIYSKASVNVISNSGIISGNIKLTGGMAEGGENQVTISTVLERQEIDSIVYSHLGAHTQVYTYESGNGIYSVSAANVDNNSGLISGDVALKGGQTTGGTSTIDYGNGEIKISSEVAAYVEANTTANGIYSGSVEVKNNSGVIRGNAQLTGGTNKLDFTSASIEVYPSVGASAEASANGIYNGAKVTVDNNGIISGNAQLKGGTIEADGDIENTESFNVIDSANGIYGDNVEVDNSGVISGYIFVTAGTTNGSTSTGYIRLSDSGNGIFSASNIKVTNTGLIKGGVYFSDESMHSYINASGYAIKANGGEVTNYGILAAGNGGDETVLGAGVTDYGLNVFVDKNGEVTDARLGYEVLVNVVSKEGYSIINSEITNNGYTIINVADDSENQHNSVNLSDIIEEKNNLIINGVGTTTGALMVDSTTTNGTIKNSIVNGYNTALTVNGGNLTATNTTFNGGGYQGKISVVDIKKSDLTLSGTSAVNGNTTVDNGKLTVLDTSVLNGDLALSNNSSATFKDATILNGNATVNGNSMLSLGNHIQLNGNLSGDESGTLNLGDGSTNWNTKTGAVNSNGRYVGHGNDASSGDLKIYQNISGFGTMNINGQVTTYETAKVSKVGELHIDKNSQLVVRVNPLMNGKYTGITSNHALYDIDGEITAAAGSKLIFKTNGMQDGDIIDMDNTDISALTNDQIDTWSILHTAKKYHGPKTKEVMSDETRQSNEDNDDGDIIIGDADFWEIFPPGTVDPGKPKPGCNEGEPWCPIYESIKNANQLNELDPTGDADDSAENRIEGLLSMLDQIYANNPYNHSSMLAFKNVTALRWQIFETKMPKLDEWIASAHVDYTKAQQTKDRDFVLGDISLSNKYQTDLSNYSALVTAEHGYKQDQSIGFAFGATHSKAKMSHNSKLDGNSFYLGLFNKHKVNNFEFVLGTGFSFGTYDGTRTISNQYQSLTNNGKVQTATFDVYGEAKYRYALNDSTFLEPKIRLSEVIVRQSEVNEDPNALAINQDYKMYHVPTASIGMDLSKQFALSNSVLKAKVGVFGERTFGHWDNLIGARIQNSTDFVVQGAQFQRSSVNLTAGLEHDLGSTLFYKIALNYAIAQREKHSLDANLSVGSSF